VSEDGNGTGYSLIECGALREVYQFEEVVECWFEDELFPKDALCGIRTVILLVL
jgi:hypothetical protein